MKALFQYRLEPLMKYYGLRKIDLWLLTHGDEDHISGIREALEEGRAEIEKIAFPDIDGDDALENIEILAKKRGIPVVRLLRGDEFEAGNFHFDCLHPVGTAVGGDKKQYVPRTGAEAGASRKADGSGGIGFYHAADGRCRRGK